MKKIIMLVVLSVMLAGCGEKEKEFDATGTFETTEVTVSAKAAGELIYFRINEGEEVQSDSVVGMIDNTQLQLKKEQLATQRSQLESARRQLDANKSQLDANRSQLDANKDQMASSKKKVDYTQRSALSQKLDLEKQLGVIRQQIANQRRELQRFTELYNDGAVARKQVDDIAYSISVLEKQLAATEDQIISTNLSIDNQLAGMEQDKTGIDAQIQGVVAQQSGVDAQRQGLDDQQQSIDAQIANIGVQQAQLDDQVANTLVKSPIEGTILEKYVEQGEFMTAGKPMFKIADTRNMFMRAYITSLQLGKIHVGQTVEVMTDYGKNQGKKYKGVVSWISSKAEFTPKTIVTDEERADLVYAVKIAVKNDGGIKTGMYGKVKF